MINIPFFIGFLYIPGGCLGFCPSTVLPPVTTHPVNPPRNARGITACQRHLAGTSIASFNDALRGAVLGGNAFEDPRIQGATRLPLGCPGTEVRI